MKHKYLISLSLVVGFVLVISFSLSQSPAQASGVVSGACGETEFDTALAGGGLVTFDCGASATINLTNSKTISNDVVIDAEGADITLMLSNTIFVTGSGNLELRGIILDTSATNLRGIGVDSELVVTNSTFRHFGMGILAYGGSNVRVYNSLFEQNGDPNGDGAGIWANGYLEVHASIFRNNHSYDDAAGIEGAGGTYIIEDSLFEGNSAGIEADGSAPAIRLGGNITIRRSSFINNSVTNGACAAIGVGIDFPQSTITIDESYFSGNSGGFEGGAVCIIGGATANITNSTFIGNQVPGRYGGGAIYGGWNGTSNQVTLRNNCFMDNVATAGNDIYNSGSLEMDAASNYWGDPAGPQVNDIFGAVNTASPLAECGGFVPTPTPEQTETPSPETSVPIIYHKIGQIRVVAPGIRLYDAPAGGPIRDSVGNEIWVPNQTADNPYEDTYDVVGQTMVDEVMWVEIFTGNTEFVWVPIGDNVTIIAWSD